MPARALCIGRKLVLACAIAVLSTAIPATAAEPAKRNDREFMKLWASLHECKTRVFLEGDELSSEYLRSRGYAPVNSGSGWATFEVDERFHGFRVRELLVPTTQAILALTIDAPVTSVRETIEKERRIKFAEKTPTRFILDLANETSFEVLADRKDSQRTIVMCEHRHE